MSTATAPPRGTTPARLLAAVALAAGGVFGLVRLSAALGYGDDVHATRAVAAGVALFLGATIALRPGAAGPVRGLALLAGLGGAAAAWWWVPAGSGGPSLAAAVADRDDVALRTAEVPAGNVPEVAALKARSETLAGTFPALAAGLRPGLSRRADEAETSVTDRFRSAPTGDLAAYRRAEAEADALAGAYPDRRAALDAAARDWVSRAVAARVAELDADGFHRTAAARHALAEALPDTRARLAAAEDEQVRRWAEAHVALPFEDGTPSPRDRRDRCREAEAQVLELRSLDVTPGRFLAARTVLFRAAHEAAREECRGHLEAGRYDAAFGVARAHAVEWFATAELLGPDGRRSLADLRDGYRYLAALAEKVGSAPDAAPPPRTRP